MKRKPKKNDIVSMRINYKDFPLNSLAIVTLVHGFENQNHGHLCTLENSSGFKRHVFEDELDLANMKDFVLELLNVNKKLWTENNNDNTRINQ